MHFLCIHASVHPLASKVLIKKKQWTDRYVSVYLSSRTVASQVLSAPRSLTSVFGMGTGVPCASKTLTASGQSILCWHFPIFPGRRQPSIVSTIQLNFRVRNGNGCTLYVKNTNFPSRFIPRKDLVHLQGFEPGTH